ncbi:hypothetical protein BLNAU_22645 [Blattamonas nauphoetae]|uniref:Uncharacterized protein n=1 Tax=Blattamonas nauphoetae TaxID=2049346 RepID=A0ABQ9WSI4_9EUKA|nr:hypothetical protein BLNAU_22645 [Blattamonas nauphoetae]
MMLELVTESMSLLSLEGSPESRNTLGVDIEQSRRKCKRTSLLKEITRIDESRMFPEHVQLVTPSGPAEVSLSPFTLDSLQQTLSLLIADFKNHHIHQTPTATILSSTPQNSQIEQKSQDLFNLLDSIILLQSTPYALLSTRFRLALRIRDNSIHSLIAFVFIKKSFIFIVLNTAYHHSSLQFFPFTLHHHPFLSYQNTKLLGVFLLLISLDTSDLTRQAPNQRQRHTLSNTLKLDPIWLLDKFVMQ